MAASPQDPSPSLIQAALEVRAHAHAPYSKYQVGASLGCANGEILVGTNMENASYGLTICAERVALGSWVAAGKPEAIEAVVVATLDGASPCGACRQVLAEFVAPDCPIYGVNERGEILGRWRMQELLPAAFSLVDS